MPAFSTCVVLCIHGVHTTAKTKDMLFGQWFQPFITCPAMYRYANAVNVRYRRRVAGMEYYIL